MTQHPTQGSQSGHKHSEFRGAYTARKGFKKCGICLEMYSDSQSELEGLVADIIGDARSIDVGFVADETSKYQAALNEGVKTIEAYVTTRLKEAGDNYHNEITANETKVWISRTDFEQRLKEAERLARIDELERFTSEPRRSADSFHQDVYVIKTARLDQRIEALTTTTNGKELEKHE